MAALAVDRHLERGRRNAAEGRLHAIDEDGISIVGTVSSSGNHEVRIRDSDDLACARDCPIGEGGGRT